MAYSRPWESFPEQLELLKSRGMVVTDETVALERIEISLRVDLSYLLGKRSPFAHIENTKAHFHPGFASRPSHRGSQQSAFDAWLNKYRGLVSRSKEDFVRHYHTNHGEELPIWVAVEVLDFGAISQLFSMLHPRDP